MYIYCISHITITTSNYSLALWLPFLWAVRTAHSKNTWTIQKQKNSYSFWYKFSSKVITDCNWTTFFCLSAYLCSFIRGQLKVYLLMEPGGHRGGMSPISTLLQAAVYNPPSLLITPAPLSVHGQWWARGWVLCTSVPLGCVCAQKGCGHGAEWRSLQHEYLWQLYVCVYMHTRVCTACMFIYLSGYTYLKYSLHGLGY